MDSIGYAVQDLLEGIRESVRYILSLGPRQFARSFWALLFLEVPRYLFSDLYVLVKSLLGGTRAPLAPHLDPPPLVSVILPVLDERDIVGETVRSLREQGYPNLEILVIDDGSLDGTQEVCEGLGRRGWVRFLGFPHRQGKSAALNWGLQHANGKYVVFMDSDSTLDRGALRNLLAYFADPEVGAVCGDLSVRNPRVNLLTRLQTMEYLTALTIGRTFRAGVGILSIVPGAFGGFRRELIDRVGGHEPGPGNDSDLTIRTRKLGYKVAYAPDATCLTNTPESWKGWLKQRLRWDRNLIRNRLRKHMDVYAFWQRHFSLSNLVSFVDTMFFAVVLSLGWLVYAADLSIRRPEHWVAIAFASYLLHLLLKTTQYAIALAVTPRRKELFGLAVYLPLFSFYRIVCRIVRLVAVIQEVVFRKSYRDPFAPEKVRKEMIVY